MFRVPWPVVGRRLLSSRRAVPQQKHRGLTATATATTGRSLAVDVDVAVAVKLSSQLPVSVRYVMQSGLLCFALAEMQSTCAGLCNGVHETAIHKFPIIGQFFVIHTDVEVEV